MKKQQYVAAIACLVAGAIGFVSVYATDQVQKKRELAKQQQEVQIEDSQKTAPASQELKPQKKTQPKETQKAVPEKEPEIKVEQETGKTPDNKPDNKPADKPEETVPTVVAEALHFDTEKGIIWPVEGEVLMSYSMDNTIYHATLDQYKCNPALIISGAVNDKVHAVAKGKIIQIYNSEETGCTVKQDLGDGYTAIYGQIKEPNFKVGDILEEGQIVGYVGEPTKYYAVEGANVYFELQKNGEPVNPTDYLPLQTIDTLE